MDNKLVIKELLLSEFRSWRAGKFTFSPGITLVTGQNGAGKSTIGMGVQFAVNGKVPKLTKDDLRRRGATSPTSAKLVCERNGVPLTISRSMTKCLIRQGDESVSVRDNAFMEELKRSVEYSFLSQQVTAFTDMQEYKRRELLDSLIPEVTLLRSTCAPSVKNIVKNYFQRRYLYGTNISQAESTLEDMERTIVSAKAAMTDEKRRQEAILAAQEQKLPFSEAEYETKKKELHNINETAIQFRRYLQDASRWLEVVREGNRQIKLHQDKQVFYTSEKTKLEAYLKSLKANDKPDELVCQSCNVPLKCCSCGAQQYSGVTTKGLNDLMQQTSQRLLQIEQQISDISASMQNMQATDETEIANTQMNFNRASNDLNAIEAQMNTLRDDIAKYETVYKSVENARKLAVDASALEGMKRHISDLTMRKAVIADKIERKRKVYEVMEKTEQKLTAAADIMYTTLPMLYFDRFLQRLTYACNYLLKSISNMKIEMGASAEGISIYVSGSKLAQLSSGELQRVRVAVTLSFSLLAVRTDTLFLDEMFDTALDADGLDALATMLRGPVSKFYDKIIVITHNASLMAALAPNRIINLDKEAEGATVAKEQA